MRNMSLIKVINEIENIGNVLVSVDYASCSVRQVMPWPSKEAIQNSVMLEELDIEIDYEYKNKNEENDEDRWPPVDFRHFEQERRGRDCASEISFGGGYYDGAVA